MFAADRVQLFYDQPRKIFTKGGSGRKTRRLDANRIEEARRVRRLAKDEITDGRFMRTKAGELRDDP